MEPTGEQGTRPILMWICVIIPAEILSDGVTASEGQSRVTHTDIWWWLGGRKLHHVAPDVSRLVPRGWGAHQHTQTDNIQIHRKTSCWRPQRQERMERIYMFNMATRWATEVKYIPVRAICSVGWNLMELTVRRTTKMRHNVASSILLQMT